MRETDPETYSALVAQRDAGEITNTDYFRAIRAAGLTHTNSVARAYRQAISLARRHHQGSVRYTRTQRELSTDQLTADLDGADPVKARYARELLRLDTVDQRIAAWRDARRFLNATPDAGRPSDALRSGVNAILNGYAA